MRSRCRFSQQSGSSKRHRDERSESSDDCVHGSPVGPYRVWQREEAAEANEPQPAKTASRREEPPADRNDRSLPASLFDGCICIVCYWTGTALVNWTAAAFTVRVEFNGVCYFCNAPKSFFDRHGAGRFFRLDVADLLQMGAPFMKSLVIKRSVVVAGHKTSVSLEDAF